MESNIDSDVRGKIHKIPDQADHPDAQSVAKVICLLQFVQSVHRTAENVAAALHPAADAPPQLEMVKEALRVLEGAGLVRHGEDGYRIPTPAEDDWERQRNGASPRPADTKRLHREIVTGFWTPQPRHTLLNVKPFKAGLLIDGREEAKGALVFHLTFAEEGEPFAHTVEEIRTRSQQEDGTVFWVVPLNDTIDRATVELHRSRDMLSRKARDAKTKDETALVTEERNRERRHTADLQRLLRTAVLGGTAFFRGNDRSPAPTATDVGKAASAILGQVLPDVFTGFNEGAATANDSKRGLDELLKADNLEGLTDVFTTLGLLRDEGGKTVFDTDVPALRAVYAKIEHDADYGTKATGRSLTEHFGGDPYGWDFDVTRLLVAVLLSADKIQLRHGSTDIDSRRGIAAKEALTNNNNFRSASCAPKKGIDFAEIAKAAGHFKGTFGSEIKDISSQSAVVAALREELMSHEDELRTAQELLRANQLPGVEMLAGALTTIKDILQGTEETAIAEFNSSFQTIKDATKRARELNHVLTPKVVHDVVSARRALQTQWLFLDDEPDLDDDTRAAAEQLADLLNRETFFRELADIDASREAIEKEYDCRFREALAAKVDEYSTALERLVAMDSWPALDDDVRKEIARPLRQHADDEGLVATPVSQLRSDRDACRRRLQEATRRVHAVIDGDRVVPLNVRPYFGDGIESADQLEAALDGIREECERLIADDKKIIIE